MMVGTHLALSLYGSPLLITPPIPESSQLHHHTAPLCPWMSDLASQMWGCPEESIGSLGWMGQGSHPESTGGITHGCPLAGILASLAANLAGLASQTKIT